MKKIWITSLDKDEKTVQQVMAVATRYGLGPDGHFWQDDLEKMAWVGVKEQLLDTRVTLWVILGSGKELQPETRYGLTLLKLVLERERPALSILWMDKKPDAQLGELPGAFASVVRVPVDSGAVGAKFAAMANMPAGKSVYPYRLFVHANPGLGVWFEVGPSENISWTGALFGIHEGEIKAMGFGPAGELPDKCVLEYPLRGVQLEAGDTQFLAWGARNVLTDEKSAYFKVDGVPRGLLFGELPEGEEADLHRLAV